MSVWDGWSYESHATIALLNHWISTVGYHPDWKFRTTYGGRPNDIVLVVEFKTLDSNDSDVERTQASWRVLQGDDIDSRKSLVGAIHGIIYQMQNHEIDEWLRVDGVRVYDSHMGARYAL